MTSGHVNLLGGNLAKTFGDINENDGRKPNQRRSVIIIKTKAWRVIILESSGVAMGALPGARAPQNFVILIINVVSTVQNHPLFSA